jgi:hypothetical protein
MNLLYKSSAIEKIFPGFGMNVFRNARPIRVMPWHGFVDQLNKEVIEKYQTSMKRID